MSSKYGKKLFDIKKTGNQCPKTASKRAIEKKKAETTGNVLGNMIGEKISKSASKSIDEDSKQSATVQIDEQLVQAIGIPKEIHIPPKKLWKIIDELPLSKNQKFAGQQK